MCRNYSTINDKSVYYNIMSEVDGVNLDLNSKKLNIDIKKRSSLNNATEGIIEPPFSAYIEQALNDGEVETTTKEKEIIQKKSIKNNKIKESYPKIKENLKIKENKEDDFKLKNSDISKDTKKIDTNKKDIEPTFSNLQSAFSIVEQRITEFFYLTPTNDLRVKEVSEIKEVHSPVTVEDLFSKLVAQVKKIKAGHLEKLKISLQPEELGNMDIIFTILEEDRKKKLFISFAGSEDALVLIKKNKQRLTDKLTSNGQLSLASMDFILYGGVDHQKLESSTSQTNVENQDVLPEVILKTMDKKDIIKHMDKFVADLVVSYIA